MLGRVVSLPLDLLTALRQLPLIARDTNRMAEHTEVLAEVALATQALPELQKQMAAVAAAMPVLVEVQRHLAKLPETIERLDVRISELSVLLEGLQASLEPVGRIARRLPGQRS